MDRAEKIKRRNTLLDPEEPIGALPKRHTGINGHAGEYAPRRTRWQLRPETIIEKLKTNRTFKVGLDFDVTGLPVFADLTPYGISEEKQLELFSLEIHRLVNVVNSAEPLELEGEAEWFGQADKDGYARLDKLARQMKLAMAICVHDLELQMLEHHPADSHPDNFRQAREDLLQEFGPDSPKDPVAAWSGMRLTDHNDEAFHAVVNYLTGTITQVLLRTMHGDFWDSNCIISMAKCAAKIKVMAMDLVNATETCLAGKREWTTRMKRITDLEPNPPAAEEKTTAVGNQLQCLARCIVIRGRRYFEVTHAFGHGILVLLLTATEDVGSNLGAALPPDVFESSSIVYDTGFRGHRSLICQERNGGIGASSNRDEVHCASFSFEVCLNAFESLAQRLPATASKAGGVGGPTTLLYWKWTEMRSELDEPAHELDIFKGDPRTGQRDLSLMSDVITAFVPFLMTCGRFSRQLASMTKFVISISDHGDPLSMCIETRFLASFMIQTSEHKSFKKRNVAKDREVTSVSESTLAEGRALAEGPMSSTRRSPGLPDNRLRRKLLEKNKEISHGLEIMNRWTIDSSSIIIQSRRYCWGTLACCAALVFGGLAIGFTVNQRIRGVDPFNISVFCWALAGFMIIFMKSLRVENWPWRDFFKGRVVCRSVSEVTAVSGIDAHLFLSILLRLEVFIQLEKHGPFRGVFVRKADNPPDGFSIDVPFTTESLTDGGYFFIKVRGTNGPALVGIQSPIGMAYQVVKPQSYDKDEEVIKCPEIRETGKWGKGDGQKKLYYTTSNALRWSRVDGLFCGDAYFC